MYAAGKIPGGFIKREGRASEAATLAARLTDRPIRPLFPEGYKDDIQLVITVLSTDHENDPDILGTIAASAALTISEIPFQGPVGSVRVGYIDGEFVLNPTYPQLADSQLDLVVSGTRDAIMMVEAGVKILPEDVMAEAILFGHRSLAAAHRAAGEAARARGQAEARSRTSSPRPTPCSSSPSWRRPAASSSSSTSRPPAPTPRWPTSSRSPRSASRAARSPTAGRPSSTPGARSSATRCTASPTRTSRARRPRPRRPARRSTSSAARRSSAIRSASTSGSSRRPSATARASPRARTWTRS